MTNLQKSQNKEEHANLYYGHVINKILWDQPLSSSANNLQRGMGGGGGSQRWKDT